MAHSRLLQSLHGPVSRPQHLCDVGIDVGLIRQGGKGGGHRNAVDVIGTGHATDAVDHSGVADSEPDPQRG